MRLKRVFHARTTGGPTIGSGNHNDPEWLLENITLDQIEAMLASVVPALDSDAVNVELSAVTPLFTDWERELVISLNEQYDTKHLKGYHDRPLSGRQLFYLHKFYARVALDTAAALR
jgi:hypothetical protein